MPFTRNAINAHAERTTSAIGTEKNAPFSTIQSDGIVSSEGERLFAHRALGLVQDAFGQHVIEKLPGDRAIGHVRYSTAGDSGLKNAQPIAVDYAHGSHALAHNGNLTNFGELRVSLEDEG